MVIGKHLIEEAAARVGSRVRLTPTIEIEPGAFDNNAPLTLKLELLQHTGSFKPRGAFNRVLASVVPDSGVIAASGGNHGAAVVTRRVCWVIERRSTFLSRHRRSS